MGPTLAKPSRTLHLQGSAGRDNPGDALLPAGTHIIVEEKLDASHCAISFDTDARLWIAHRGQWLTDPLTREWQALRAWCDSRAGLLADLLEDRYVLHGEWMLAKHTVFYDALPDLLMEYDIHDRRTGRWLDTATRRRMLDGTGIISVPVLHEGPAGQADLAALAGESAFRGARNHQRLLGQAKRAGVQAPDAVAQTLPGRAMEGVYVKAEADGRVTGRFKWIRPDFLSCLLASGSHWANRPIIENLTA